MKSGSDNFRESAIQGIISRLKEQGDTSLIIFEPLLKDKVFHGIPVESDLQSFKNRSDIILANRFDSALLDVFPKVYTRDVFHNI